MAPRERPDEASYGLMEATSEPGPLSAPATIDSWLSAADGDASGLWFSSLLADMASPESFVWGEMAATARAATARFSSGGQRDSILGDAGTRFIWGDGGMARAWPANGSEGDYTRVLRSVYPIVLGLGGWFLGALVDMTTMPGVALDDELLAVLSVGVPVGLGVYWAWVRAAWSAEARTAGCVAAMAGALIGAWLGFNAGAGLLALITAIAGATAGANLAVIVLDMTWDKWIGSRLPTEVGTTPSPERRAVVAA